MLNHLRYIIPTVKALLDKVTGAELDLEMAMTDEETQSLQELKASQTWRALRLSTSTKLSKFDQLDDTKNINALLEETDNSKLPQQVNVADVQDDSNEDVVERGTNDDEATNLVADTTTTQ